MDEPLFGELISKHNDQVTLQLDGEIDAYKLDRFRNGKRPMFQLQLLDRRRISPDQRKKIYALIGDIANYTGYSIPQEMPGVMKWRYLTETGAEMFSLSSCSMT